MKDSVTTNLPISSCDLLTRFPSTEMKRRFMPFKTLSLRFLPFHGTIRAAENLGSPRRDAHCAMYPCAISMRRDKAESARVIGTSDRIRTCFAFHLPCQITRHPTPSGCWDTRVVASHRAIVVALTEETLSWGNNRVIVQDGVIRFRNPVSTSPERPCSPHCAFGTGTHALPVSQPQGSNFLRDRA